MGNRILKTKKNVKKIFRAGCTVNHSCIEPFKVLGCCYLVMQPLWKR